MEKTGRRLWLTAVLEQTFIKTHQFICGFTFPSSHGALMESIHGLLTYNSTAATYTHIFKTRRYLNPQNGKEIYFAAVMCSSYWHIIRFSTNCMATMHSFFNPLVFMQVFLVFYLLSVSNNCQILMVYTFILLLTLLLLQYLKLLMVESPFVRL